MNRQTRRARRRKRCKNESMPRSGETEAKLVARFEANLEAVITVAFCAGFHTAEAKACGYPSDATTALVDCIEASGLPFPVRRRIAVCAAKALKELARARRDLARQAEAEANPTVH